jgi:uncharacterized protein YecE (DUF72 family)
MQLFVGLTLLTGGIERYAGRFDLLEFRADPRRLPTLKTLRRMRATAPKLRFSILVPPALTAAALDAPDRILPILESAEAVGASFIVLQTGPELGPSPRMRARLAALVKRMEAPGRSICWEPHGPWEEATAWEQAEALGMLFVQDLSVAEATPNTLVYTRLRSLGPGAALKGSALTHLAEQLSEVEQAFIVIEGRPSPRARARILRILDLNASALSDDEDDDDDADGDDDEDEDEAAEDEASDSEGEGSGDEDEEEDDDDDDDEALDPESTKKDRP